MTKEQKKHAEIVGYLDDAAVLALCLKLVQGDVDDYRQWQTKRLAA